MMRCTLWLRASCKFDSNGFDVERAEKQYALGLLKNATMSIGCTRDAASSSACFSLALLADKPVKRFAERTLHQLCTMDRIQHSF